MTSSNLGRIANYLGKIDLERPERKAIVDIVERIEKELKEANSRASKISEENTKLRQRIKELESAISKGNDFKKYQYLVDSVSYKKLDMIREILEETENEFETLWGEDL